MTTAKRYWAWLVQGDYILGEGDTLGPWLYEKKPKRDERTRYVNAKLVRVEVRVVEPECRSGCGMVDDVPVFCKRHKPQERTLEGK